LPTDCKFCQIVADPLAAARVYENERCVAFLDFRPLMKGHTLVVPREHHETLIDAPPDLVAEVFSAVRRIAGALESGLGCEGSFVAMNNRVSQSVPHLHVHVVPRRRGDGLRGFFWPRLRYESDAEAEDFRRRIALALR
jgi:histidine triad (HIT) family protein